MPFLSRQMFTAPRIVIAAGLLAAGGAIGAGAALITRPTITMVPVIPVRIATLAARNTSWSRDEIVTVRGKIAEVYGDRFVVTDGSGRILVEAGPHGDDANPAIGQPVTVQGRYHDQVLRAMFLVGADGRVLGGPHGDHGPRHDRRGHDGPPDRDGPGRGGLDRDGPDHPAQVDQAPPPPPASQPSAG